MISRVLSRGLMVGLMVGTLLSAAPIAFAADPLPVREPLPAPAPQESPREPIPAPDPRISKAREELAVIIQELDKARREIDPAKKKAALDAARAKLKTWNETYLDLRNAAAEAEARKIQNKGLNELLALEKQLEEKVQAIKDPKLQQLVWQGYLLRLREWRDTYCTKEGQPKDPLFTTMLNCNNILEMIRRAEAKIAYLQAVIDKRLAVITPSSTPVVYVAYEDETADVNSDVDVDYGI